MSSAGAATTPRKLRILALHGFASNAFTFQRRLGAIRKSCKDVAEFITINAPIRVEPITPALRSLDDDNDRTTTSNDDIPLEEQPRAWWRANDKDGTYTQFDDSIDFLNDELAKHVEHGGPFDGVYGYSQGACFAPLVASALEDPSRYPRLRRPNGQGPLRFCISVCGFIARDANLQQHLYPSDGIQTPILHIMGKDDPVVESSRSLALNAKAANLRVEYHNSGHLMPSQAPWRNFLHDFIASFQDSSLQNWQTVKGPSERAQGETADHRLDTDKSSL